MLLKKVGPYGKDELLRKAEVVRDLEKCSLVEEMSWKQKSRVLWLKEGDKCTKFFSFHSQLK
jgi:hypothetical protein